MNRTKERVVNSLIKKFNFTKCGAQTLVDNFFDQLCVAVIKGHAVKIHGFGNFAFSELPNILTSNDK